MILAPTRLVDVSDLVATGDIAVMFGVATPTVCCWKTRYADFPAAVHQTSGGPLYLRSEVTSWHQNRTVYGPRAT